MVAVVGRLDELVAEGNVDGIRKSEVAAQSGGTGIGWASGVVGRVAIDRKELTARGFVEASVINQAVDLGGRNWCVFGEDCEVVGVEGRDASEGSHAGRGRGAEVILTALTDAVALKVGKVEELVFLDGATGLTTPAVVVIAGIRDLAALNGVFSVEVAVLEVFVGNAVELVGAAADGGVELTAGGVAELRREDVDDGGELADSVVGHIDQRPGDRLVVIVDTFNGVVVVFRAKSADRGAGSNAETAAGGDAGNEQREIDNTCAAGCRGQILELFRFKAGRKLGGRGVDDGACFSRDLDNGGSRGNRQDHVGRGGCIEGNREVLQSVRSEAGGSRRDVVISGKQVRDVEVTDLAGLGSGGYAGGDVGGRDRGVGNDGAAAINDCAGDIAAGGLAPSSKTGADQKDGEHADCEKRILEPE